MPPRPDRGAAPAPGASRPDLEACAREPIQFLGGVQSFGCLFVISSDWIVQNVSENCAALTGLAPAALVGTRLIDHLTGDAMHALRGRVQAMGSDDEGAHVFGLEPFGDGRRFDVALHRGRGTLLVEFEPSPEGGGGADPSTAQALIARVRRGGDIEGMCEVATNAVWALTGFDRVMLYRFEPDYSGVVIAECLGAGADSYLGQRFPASDIPPQARALYERSLIRIIADVDAPVAPLEPPRMPDGSPVDLSLAVTRAVSPIHLQYLRNMGVQASMSMSILRDGRLWGMIACHHPRPHYVDYRTRRTVELFTQLLAYELALAEAAAEREHAARAYEVHERLSLMFSEGLDLGLDLEQFMREIAGLIGHDGVALRVGETYRSRGMAPTEAEFAALSRHLARVGGGRVFATDRLEDACPGTVAPERGLGGFLAIPVSREPPAHVLLLRREVTQSITWAGPPQKEVLPDGRLSPRQSFEAWREEVSGRSAPWSEADLRAAEVLRVSLLEMLVKRGTEASLREQQRSHRQEVVIAELNHRLRNLFAMAQGVVTRGAEGGGPELRDFALETAERLERLARANDRLTAEMGEEESLRGIVADEAEAFAGALLRIRFTGGDATLRAQARTTLRLVIHELVTNAVKHGALRPTAEGSVEVGCARHPRGVEFRWTEACPAPDAPRAEGPAGARVGFGATLLARAIPHELGGEAQVEQLPGGLAARFLLPEAAIGGFAEDAPAPLPAGAARAAAGAAAGPGPGQRGAARLLSGAVLVVEDNLMIAMNAADALRGLGAAEVTIAGNLPDALARVAAQRFELALLDVDLGGASAAPVAAALRDRGVPFVVASGYDAASAAEPAAFRGVPRLRKPYSNEGVASMVRASLAERAAAQPSG